MTTPSVEAQAPPEQEAGLIASWGGLRLIDLGAAQAAVTMQDRGIPLELARLSYGIIEAASPVEWNDAGKNALEQYKRDALDTKIYSAIARWLRGRS